MKSVVMIMLTATKIVLFFLFIDILVSCVLVERPKKLEHYFSSSTISYPLVFLSMSKVSGDEMCVCVDPSYLYYQLNMKVIPQDEFYEYLYELDEKGKSLIVSDTFFEEQKKNAVEKNTFVDSLYSVGGVNALISFVRNRGKLRCSYSAFDYLGYILWKNNVFLTWCLEDGVEWIEINEP